MTHVLLVAAIVLAACGRADAQDVSPLVHEGIIEAPLDAVWTAWTTSEGLRSWMAPHADIELRVGGRMRANYNPRGQLGDAQTIENSVLSFEPSHMLSIKVASPPAGFPFPNAIQRMWTVIYLDAAAPGRTRMRSVSLGFGPDEESQKMRAFSSQGQRDDLERTSTSLRRGEATVTSEVERDGPGGWEWRRRF